MPAPVAGDVARRQYEFGRVCEGFATAVMCREQGDAPSGYHQQPTFQHARRAFEDARPLRLIRASLCGDPGQLRRPSRVPASSGGPRDRRYLTHWSWTQPQPPRSSGGCGGR